MDSKKQNSEPLILLKIQTKQGVLFNDRVKAITSFNEKGIFDVLPQHENFISVIKDKIIIHTTDGKDKEMKIDNGVLKVHENEAHIFLGLTEANV
ncbi:MAG: hypothetical protein A3B44_01100 [Candidatus Levybacteria bacterium RIFCSPLOWO2_01_FULL_38_21]|nr:MAG: hypothetical protein A3B44_01100 [Candidatus Levybacteria bacterium RIFCSPLOWO2_01_FULL_38_21]